MESVGNHFDLDNPQGESYAVSVDHSGLGCRLGRSYDAKDYGSAVCTMPRSGVDARQVASDGVGSIPDPPMPLFAFGAPPLVVQGNSERANRAFSGECG